MEQHRFRTKRTQVESPPHPDPFARRSGWGSPSLNRDDAGYSVPMIILGIILAILGLLFDAGLFTLLGLALILVGLVLNVRGPRNWY